MAIKVGGTTVVDDSRNLTNVVNGTLAGKLWLGSSNPGPVQFANYLPITGGINAYSNASNPTVASDVTNSAVVYNTYVGTQAAAFTLGNLSHYVAGQGTIGAGSAITNQYGFNAQASLTGATNNYGFIGAIAAGTGRYNLYMAGTADNYLAGKLGIGVNPTNNNAQLVIGGTNTLSSNTEGFAYNGTFGTGVTYRADAFFSYPSVNNPTGTLSFLNHFYAVQNTLSTPVANQYGFNAGSNLTGATNNYGFIGDIAAGTGRYNLYMAGSADNYLAGSLGIGGTAAGTSLVIAKTLTGATSSRFVWASGNVGSDVTSNAFGFATNIGTQTASFSLPELPHFYASQGTFGAGSAVTGQSGFYAQSSLTGATNNFGFFGNIAAGTGRYNLYMSGSADNYLAGKLIVNNALGFGTAGSPSYGTAGQVLTSAGSGAVPTWTTPSTNLASGVTGTLPVGNGGTGVTTSTGSGSTVLSTSPTLVTPILGTPTSGTLTSCTGLPLSTGVTGTLPVANGGTGLTSVGTNGQVLTSNGTSLSWTTISAGATLSDDTATNATYYPTFAVATSGSMTTAKVSSTKLQFNPSTGMLYATNYTSLSDATLKENVAPLVGSLDVLKQLDGVSYNWKDNGHVGYGFIAQEVEKVLPTIIATDDAGIKSIQYISLIAFLTEAVKELSDRVATLESK